MTEFTKLKMHFTLALLGTLFALHPVVERVADYGFWYGFKDWQVYLKIFYPYALIAGLLAFTIYCYALSFMSDKPASWSEKLGNYSYTLAVLVLPIYGGLYLADLLARELELTELKWAVRLAPIVPVALGGFWVLVNAVVALWLRKRLSDKDRAAKIEQLAHQEVTALDRAPDLFATNHFDLAVIEAWKALEARLRRSLLLHGYRNPGDKPEDVIHAAQKARLLSPTARTQVQELKKHWHVALGTEPLSREAADSSLKLVRDILSTVPVAEQGKEAK
jgi:hypothetical protein